MRLTRYTDYALRVLIYLSARPGRLCSIAEIAEAYGISHNHLTKVVHELGKAGYLTTLRGRAGGIRLAKPSDEIRIGEIVRATEDGFDLADCRNCVIAPACGMTSVLGEAVAAFLSVLDNYTFADLPKREIDILSLFPMAEAPTIAAQVAAFEAAGRR
ncbi:Rrf2 family transcriptional regulator [Jiella pacifica]|uniref:Rrf2 family transcriptional regulator n=1 Tax=Jiella pacifica TaxID=2696469 RepID=A0A6N9T8E5_9HYPH|nr:Rrf2 family transcriptional regulator [Jiella pacifica]NDW07683.1 Rrf2 family transcriptional regulator [Jiella pacifica]